MNTEIAFSMNFKFRNGGTNINFYIQRCYVVNRFKNKI